MNQSELVISHKDIGELRVLGVERVLESLEVTAVLGTGSRLCFFSNILSLGWQ